jgi:multidrug efflux pump subunit AcrA (membrane-fusion protein)
MALKVTPSMNYRGPIIFGFLAFIALVALLGFWTQQSEIAGVVEAKGAVMVQSEAQTVRHADGGVVTAVAVARGATVSAGQELIVFDDQTIRTNVSIQSGRILDALVRRERLLAELNGAEVFSVPGTVADRFDQSQVASKIAQQQSLLDTRLRTNLVRQTQTVQLRAQMQTQIDRMQVQLSRATEGGEKAVLEAETAKLLDAIAGLSERRLDAEEAQTARVTAELEDIDTKLPEIEQALSIIEAQLERTRVRAPSSGRVTAMYDVAVGGLVDADAPLFDLLPDTLNRDIILDIPAFNAPRVRVGQRVELLVPERQVIVLGRVRALTIDDQRKVRATVGLVPGEIVKLGYEGLLPGLSFDATIVIEERSALSLLLEPFAETLRNLRSSVQGS